VSNIVSHGACGKSWTQVGNSTGHCGGCHETFSSLENFDAHQTTVNGKTVCADPADVRIRGLAMVAKPDPNTGIPVWTGARREGYPSSRSERVLEEAQ
jgi:hypothetical protein